MTRDLRVGLRLLASDKAFSVTAALTLAICIGANTALFSVVHHVLMRPLPVPEPERVLLMSNHYPKAGAAAAESFNSGVPDCFDRLRETSVFQEQALFNNSSVSIGQDGLPVRIRGLNVTPSFFRLVRVTPSLGRIFTEDEGQLGNEKKILLSDTLWQRRFGGDPGAVGKDLRLNNLLAVNEKAVFFTVVGVRAARSRAWFGQKRRASFSSTITTGGAVWRCASELDVADHARLRC